uniref:Uncharacterized protein n=1 Tax=Phakopsora pachyrhizi TaxID=170000 RepID=A0A0S1MIU8_PHAPC
MFQYYAPEIKALLINWLLEEPDMPLDSLQHQLGQRVLLRSIQRWKKLYTETMSVICNPDLYENPGRGRIFSKNQVEMITDLLKSNACLFLDEICGRVYETSGISCTNQTMSTVLKEYMGYTLKITSKIHINRSDVAREDYMVSHSPIPCTLSGFHRRIWGMS